MAEEFSESEVVFSDNHHPQRAVAGGFKDIPELAASPVGRSGESTEKKRVVSSVPVNIPEGILRQRRDSEEAEEEGMVPPHVIAARRFAEKMAFSVCTGNGRTLKGRDLSRVRNSVLRLTGFLEV